MPKILIQRITINQSIEVSIPVSSVHELESLRKKLISEAKLGTDEDKIDVTFAIQTEDLNTCYPKLRK